MSTKGYLVDRCPHCGKTLRQRSIEKNAHLHAVLSEISQQRQWAGQWLDTETWKRLMVAAFEREQKRSVEVYPAIDGHGVDVVYRRTSRMTQEEIRELIHFAEAWAIEQGVILRELESHG